MSSPKQQLRREQLRDAQRRSRQRRQETLDKLMEENKQLKEELERARSDMNDMAYYATNQRPTRNVHGENSGRPPGLSSFDENGNLVHLRHGSLDSNPQVLRPLRPLRPRPSAPATPQPISSHTPSPFSEDQSVPTLQEHANLMYRHSSVASDATGIESIASSSTGLRDTYSRSREATVSFPDFEQSTSAIDFQSSGLDSSSQTLNWLSSHAPSSAQSDSSPHDLTLGLGLALSCAETIHNTLGRGTSKTQVLRYLFGENVDGSTTARAFERANERLLYPYRPLSYLVYLEPIQFATKSLDELEAEISASANSQSNHQRKHSFHHETILTPGDVQRLCEHLGLLTVSKESQIGIDMDLLALENSTEHSIVQHRLTTDRHTPSGYHNLVVEPGISTSQQALPILTDGSIKSLDIDRFVYDLVPFGFWANSSSAFRLKNVLDMIQRNLHPMSQP